MFIPEEQNAFVCVFHLFNVLNQLKAPETVSSSVDLLVYFCAGDDFEVQGVSTSKIPPPLYINATAHGDMIVSETIGAQPTKSLTVLPSAVGIGEHFTSVKQLIQRFNLLHQKTVTTHGSGYQINPYQWSFVAFAPSTAVTQSPTLGGDIMSYIAGCYGTYRGSMRVSASTASATVVTNGSTAFANDTWSCSLVPNANTFVAAAPPIDGTLDWTLLGSVTGINQGFATVTGRYAVARVPYYVKTLFSVVQQSLEDLIPVLGEQPSVSASFFQSASATVPNPIFMRSACDDFSFGYFISTPLQYDSFT